MTCRDVHRKAICFIITVINYDALILSKVWEVRTSESPYTVSFNFPQNGGTLYYGYLTQYSYDLLDILTSVAQGLQTRSFNYDSFKRLLSANNPESGQTSYQYDKNGNLKQRTDANN